MLHPFHGLFKDQDLLLVESVGRSPGSAGWQQESDIFGSVLRSVVGLEEVVHVHEHVNVYVNVDEDVIVDVHVLVEVADDGFWLRSVPFDGPATIKPSALPEDFYWLYFFNAKNLRNGLHSVLASLRLCSENTYDRGGD